MIEKIFSEGLGSFEPTKKADQITVSTSLTVKSSALARSRFFHFSLSEGLKRYRRAPFVFSKLSEVVFPLAFRMVEENFPLKNFAFKSLLPRALSSDYEEVFFIGR
jgi:hypothetical protein